MVGCLMVEAVVTGTSTLTTSIGPQVGRTHTDPQILPLEEKVVEQTIHGEIVIEGGRVAPVSHQVILHLDLAPTPPILQVVVPPVAAGLAALALDHTPPTLPIPGRHTHPPGIPTLPLLTPEE